MNPIPKSAHLKSRAVLRLRGPDAMPFLQGLITQDVTPVSEGKPLFTAFLTPQGKYLFDFFVVPTPDGLLIDCPKDQTGEIVRRFAFYKMRSNIVLEDTRDLFSVLAFWSVKEASEEIQRVGFADPRLPALGRRVLLLSEKLPYIPLGSDEDAYREHRYSLGVAESNLEIEAGQATLFDINFDRLNAISWNKGCYMGQELTARMYYRGLVKKRYLPFSIEGIAPEKHASIHHQGFEIGKVEAAGNEFGLGLFNLERVRPFVEKKQLLVDAGTTFHVYLPPYMDKSVFEKTESSQ
jgi:folate-binding protein YgfZ